MSGSLHTPQVLSLPLPKSHIVTEGQLRSNKCMLHCRALLPAALTAIYYTLCGSYCECRTKAVCQDRRLLCREEETEGLKAGANCTPATEHLRGQWTSVVCVSSASIHFLLVTPPQFSFGNHLPSTFNPYSGVEVILPAHDLTLANPGSLSPWPCDRIRARHAPQARPTDSTQGLAESAGQVPHPLP